MTSARRDIQGLRAVAVIVVIADHMLHRPSGGFVGVDVFFVISGFLITGLLLREHDRTGRISFRGFYRRRIRRIVPAATAVLAVTVAGSFAILPTSRALTIAVDAIWAVLFAGNWRMAAVGTDYFQLGRPPSPLQHYWSLSVEEQFYLVWPWLILALLGITLKLGWNGPARRRALLIVMLLVSVASFTWSMFETHDDPNVAYFSTFSRAWELGVGAVIATASPFIARVVPSRARAVLAWIGLIGIVASAVFITSTTPFPGPGALGPVLSTALVIIAGTGTVPAHYDRALLPLTNRVVQYVGNISYSLYLWHFPVVTLLLAFFAEGTHRYIVVSTLTLVGLSMLSYHLVEDPIRRSSWLSGRRKPRLAQASPRRRGRKRSSVFLTAGAVVVLVCAVAIGAPFVAGRIQSSNAVSVDASFTQHGRDCRGAAFMVHSDRGNCSSSRLPATVSPTVSEAPDDTQGAFRCWRGKGAALKTCTIGSRSATATRLALVGDSHAAMLVPALKSVAAHRNWSIDIYTGYGCQWVAHPRGDCAAVTTQINTILTTSTKYDAILTTAARWTGHSSADYSAAWSKAIAHGAKVIAIADDPTVTDETLACLERVGFNPRSAECSTEVASALSPRDPLIDAVTLTPGARLVSLTDLYCTSTRCPAVIGDVIVYRDTAGHTTGTFAKSLAPYLADRIAAQLRE